MSIIGLLPFKEIMTNDRQTWSYQGSFTSDINKVLKNKSPCMQHDFFCKLLLNGAFRMIVRLVAFNFFERELKDINFHFCYSQSLVANYRKVKALYGSYKTVGWTFRLIVVLYTIERGFIVLQENIAQSIKVLKQEFNSFQQDGRKLWLKEVL